MTPNAKMTGDDMAFAKHIVEQIGAAVKAARADALEEAAQMVDEKGCPECANDLRAVAKGESK